MPIPPPAAWHSPRRPLLRAVNTLPHHPLGGAETPLGPATPLRTLATTGLALHRIDQIYFSLFRLAGLLMIRPLPAAFRAAVEE